MDVLKTCFGLILLFVAWIIVGIVNVAIIQQTSDATVWAVPAMIAWFLSGPGWVFLFLRWRGKRFSDALQPDAREGRP